jgi:DNA-binding response OmpR family regulator
VISNPTVVILEADYGGTVMPNAAAAHLGRPLRVLVVDDDRDTVQTLGILLRSEGMEVTMLQAAKEVVATAQKFHPDVVLLDIGIPERSGFDLAVDLRKRFGPNIPTLVAVTAYKSLADKCQARASGFDHYFVKPYDPKELLNLVAATKRGWPGNRA